VSERRLALAVVTGAALLRLAFAAVIPAFPDETYYWEWSRHLAAGYFDHPPAIAWLIRLGGGATPFWIRFGAIVASWIAAMATVGVARRLAGDRAGLYAAAIITAMPLAAAGLILTTPDAPLLAAIAVTLYCLVRALGEPARSRTSLAWWSATGFTLGLAFTSKYTSIFLPVGVLMAVVAHPVLRKRLAEPGPYLACVIATVVFLPVLAWNASHGWISFAYQVRHGLAAPQGSALLAAWKHEGDFFGGQAALASPILFVMGVVAVVRSYRRTAAPDRFVLAVVATVSFGFFVYSAVRQRVEPNWPAPAYIPAIALVAATDWSSTAKKWLRAGVILGAVMSVAIYVQALVPVLPIAAPRDPIARAFGWDELARQAGDLATRTSASTGHATWLGGDRYQEASELAFHLATHPRTFALNLAGRPNQYDLWPRFWEVAKPGDNLVLAVDEGDEPHAAVKALAPFFAETRKADLVTLTRAGRAIGTRRLWVLVAWNGNTLPIAAP
jgi:undecaprenyl-diphosphatase